MATAAGTVFISYASQDAAAAERVRAALAAGGVEVWTDVSALRGGDSWDREIRRRIAECTLFVPLISAHTQARAEGYFRLEWRLADQRTHRMGRSRPFIVPVCIDATREAEADVPDSFTASQWTRLAGGETPLAFVERLVQLLGAAQRSGAPLAAAAPGVRRWPRRRVIAGGLGLVALIAVIAITAVVVRRQSERPAATVTARAADDASIAVLPFVDLSAGHDQEYFSDGLTDEIIDKLAHNPSLKVIARTSSFQFRGQNQDARAIATRLGVANLLEGSVRTAGRTLRVSAQLIRAADGVHRWSETFERDIGDVFKVQDSISESVVTALRASIVPSPAEDRTTNLEAYQALLRGRYLVNRMTRADVERGRDEFKRAVTLDPRYAAAWAGIAGTYNVAGGEGWIAGADALALGRSAAERALEIDPHSARAHRVLGGLLANFAFESRRGTAEIDRAAELDPTANWVNFDMALRATSDDRRADAVEYARRGVERDPLWEPVQETYALALFRANRLVDAERAMRSAIALTPAAVDLRAELGDILIAEGHAAEALEEAKSEPNEAMRRSTRARALWRLGRRTESDALMREGEVQDAGRGAYALARARAYRGEPDQAFGWLERAYRNHEAQLTLMPGDPVLDSLHGDPRYAALLKRVGE